MESELCSLFNHVNPQREKMRKMGLPFYSEPRTITTWRPCKAHGEDCTGIRIPRGGMARLRKLLKEHGLQHRVEDLRTEGEALPEGAIPDHLLELRPYQREMVESMAMKENCLIRAGTASGKTSATIALIAQLKLPALVVVWSGGLFDQWQARIQKELGLAKKDIGVIRGAKRVLRPITIAMQQTLAKEVDPALAAYFGVVVLDEVQRAAASSVYGAINPFPARYRIGVSADERRRDGKEFLIGDLFGEVAYEITKEKLVQVGATLDVSIDVLPTAHDAPWYGVPDVGKKLDFGRLLDELCLDEARNLQVLNAAHEAALAGEQVLVMSHRREHCVELARRVSEMGHRTGLLIGGADYATEFARARDGLLDGTLRVGVGTYQAVGTGTDLPGVGVAVAATPIAGNGPFFQQVRGRVCRKPDGKTAARMVYLWDHAVFGSHLKNLCKWNAEVRVQTGGSWVPGNEVVQRLKRGDKSVVL